MSMKDFHRLFLCDFIRYRQYQSTTEVRVGELQSDVKLRTFEFDRLQLLYEENLKSLKTIQIESEKLQKKNDVC
jgi:progesterone-induced-blocking factor 1